MHEVVTFSRVTSQNLGRNDYFKGHGLEVMSVMPEKQVWLATTKKNGGVGRNSIAIPVEDLDEVVATLQRAKRSIEGRIEDEPTAKRNDREVNSKVFTWGKLANMIRSWDPRVQRLPARFCTPTTDGGPVDIEDKFEVKEVVEKPNKASFPIAVIVEKNW